ncbi:MAG: enoyl-CoA hydratase/isomerase family protein [Desulfatitalea sp.]|nr:enoyl-CoA hydratase/isomerase family protein [Desulfatitalea sp.]NNJ99644.1 enoyl-CoA hydratase/isomerase family protein [Desulfatitalea sp.]
MPEIYRAHLKDYSEKYKDTFKLKRKDGILELTFHKNGEPFQWTIDAHSAIVDLYHNINNDWENECLIVTGTGNAFNGAIDAENWAQHGYNTPYDWYKGYQVMYKRQYSEVRAILDIDIPVISAINGPIIVHPEHVLLSDIVIATPNTTFYQLHYPGLNIVPGDGCDTIWRKLLGPNRSRYIQLTGQVITAEQALDWGVIGEIVPKEKLLERAWELAETIFMSKDRWQRQLTHSLLMQQWRTAFETDLRNSLAHETLGCMVVGAIGADAKNTKKGGTDEKTWIDEAENMSRQGRGEEP